MKLYNKYGLSRKKEKERMPAAERKNAFKDGRQGFIHLIRETLPDPFVTFDYKDILVALKIRYPKILVRRTTVNQNLRSMEDIKEIKVVRIGHSNVPTIYKKCNNNEGC